LAAGFLPVPTSTARQDRHLSLSNKHRVLILCAFDSEDRATSGVWGSGFVPVMGGDNGGHSALISPQSLTKKAVYS
jgi:hypothetical protein